MWCSGQSSAQLHTGIPCISDARVLGVSFFPSVIQFPVASTQMFPGSNPLQIPAPSVSVIKSWTILRQNLYMPQPQRCLVFFQI